VRFEGGRLPSHVMVTVVTRSRPVGIGTERKSVNNCGEKPLG
jgi:hypothetical protein